MKHRDEPAPTYKEYQSLSGLKQSRYKNKHFEQIEDYEQTAAYIKKHIKLFVVDGKVPNHSDLQNKSAELKTEYNALAKFLQRKPRQSNTHGLSAVISTTSIIAKLPKRAYSVGYLSRKRKIHLKKNSKESVSPCWGMVLSY